MVEVSICMSLVSAGYSPQAVLGEIPLAWQYGTCRSFHITTATTTCIKHLRFTNIIPFLSSSPATFPFLSLLYPGTGVNISVRVALSSPLNRTIIRGAAT